MQQIEKYFLIKSFQFVLMFCMISAVASASEDISSDVVKKTQLTERVNERWERLKKYDFDGAYEFFSPVHRKVNPLEQYKLTRGRSVKWIDVTIKKVSMVGNVGVVLVEASYQLSLPGGGMSFGKKLGEINTALEERWLYKDGEWWYVTKNDERGTDI